MFFNPLPLRTFKGMSIRTAALLASCIACGLFWAAVIRGFARLFGG